MPVTPLKKAAQPPPAYPAAEAALEPMDLPNPALLSGRVETEFRTWFYSSQMQRAQVSLGLAAALVLLTCGIDLVNSADRGGRIAALVKLAVIAPLLLATMWISRNASLRHLFPQFMCASILAVGVALSLINIGGQTLGIEPRYDALVLVTVFTYFLGGLASVFACVTGLCLLGLHIFLSAFRGAPLEVMAYQSLFLLAVNAVGMLSANITERSVREAFWRYQTMTQLSELDALTQLLNRRGFDRRYAELWERAQRERRPLALAFIDLDHFKNVNDRYGHEAGDEALRQVARVLAHDTHPRPALAARLGGDEFIAVWPDLGAAAAARLADRLIHAIEDLQVRNQGAGSSVLTVSVGVSTAQPDARALAGDCMRRADQALYEAKQSGRNRYVVA